MTSCSKSEIRRCRPLLGTFVEITAAGADENALNAAINAAFAAMDKIQKLMSVHDAGSELSRLNREAASRPVTVSRELFQVLRRADTLAAESAGAFDHTIAPTLARWGLLPKHLARKDPGSWRDVRLLPGREVYYLRPLAIDLGGIAKGFAVDAAINVLQRRAIASAVVNAGGDLRGFGSQTSVVRLRHPSAPQTVSDAISLHHCALATSAPYFTERVYRGSRVSHLVDTRTRTPITGAISVSVRARACWLADALTKVVFNAPQRAGMLLAKHDAEAFVFTA
jgi:thiamine biosynthesis lipoprotein